LIKLGICNETFKEKKEFWPLKKVMEYISRLGYQGLEIAPFTLASSVEEISPARRKEIRLGKSSDSRIPQESDRVLL